MRLNLYWRGRDLIDVEIHLWKPREEEDELEPPTIEASGGGEYERADHYGDPATQHGFGFRA